MLLALVLAGRLIRQQGLELLTLKDLGQVVGDQVVVDKGLEFLPVAIRKGSSTSTQLCQDLALAFRASFNKGTGNMATFSRSKADVLKFESERVAWREGWLANALHGVEEFRGKFPISSQRICNDLQNAINLSNAISKGSDDLPRPFFPGQLLPSFQYVEFVLAKISASDLCSIPDDGEKIWEDEPCAVATPLPDRSKEDKVFVESRKLLRETPFSEGQKDQFPQIGAAESFSDWGEPPTAPNKLRLQLNSFEGEASLRVEGYSSAGRRILFNSIYALPRKVWLSPYFLSRPPKGDPPDQTVELSPSALAIVGRLKQPLLTDTNFWIETLRDRKNYESASVQALEFLDDKNSAKNFIFAGNDDTVRAVDVATTGNKLNLSFFKRLLLQFFNYERVETPSSVIWRPAYQLPSRRNNADLTNLLGLMKVANESRVLKVRDLCKFYHFIEKSTFTTRISANILTQSPNIQQPTTNATLDMLHFLGGLSDEDWSQLSSGRATTMDQIGAAKSFRQLVVKDSFTVLSKTGEAVPDLYQHPGELFREDSFGQVTAQMSASDSRMLGVISIKNKGAPRWFDGQHLRAPLPMFYRYPVGKDPVPGIDRDGWEKAVEAFETFRLGSQHSSQVRFDLPLGFYSVVEFKEPVVDDGVAYTYKTLPTELKDELWKKAQQAPPVKFPKPEDQPVPPPPPPPR